MPASWRRRPATAPTDSSLRWTPATSVAGSGPGPPARFAGTLDAWFDLVYPDDRAKVLGMHDDVVTGGASHHRFDYRVVAPDGQLRRVEGRGRVLRSADGKVLGSVGYCLLYT